MSFVVSNTKCLKTAPREELRALGVLTLDQRVVTLTTQI